ncbi:hypothetical protein HHI36_019708 [Cryptolaemus montrouzieri]|uniref:Uncharacterized protein n=1 Tax=Cryptolaemus montrouzieri TaxID=559131 RepID=A0ABD2N8L6_9CUCU
MRLSILEWILILSVVLYFGMGAEGKQGKKQQEDIEEYSNSAEQKSRKKVKVFNKYTKPEQNVGDESDVRYSKKEKTKGKGTNRIDDSADNDSSETVRGKKYSKKKNTLSESSEQFNRNSDTEIRQKGKNKKSTRNEAINEVNNKKRNKLSEEPSESLKTYKKTRKQRSVPEDLNEEDTPKKVKFSAKQQKTQKRIESEEIAPTRKNMNKVRLEETESNEDGETEENSTADDVESDSQFCTSDDCPSIEERHNDDKVEVEEVDTEDEGEELEIDKEIVLPKKIKYSTKFAHEKVSRKVKNKEAESILKLHRKAELTQKNQRNQKKNRFETEDEESSEEVRPRRTTVFEDDEI